MAKLSRNSALYKSKVAALKKARAVRSRNAKAKRADIEVGRSLRHHDKIMPTKLATPGTMDEIRFVYKGEWVPEDGSGPRSHLLNIVCLRCNADMGKGIGNALTATTSGLVALCVECAK